MTIELPKTVAENIIGFTGRLWLLAQLLTWWDSNAERIFLLSGGPGTGKSMILGWLAGFGPGPVDPVAADQLARLRSVVKAAHFCQASSRNISPLAFAENIANQLTGTVKGFGDALAATLAERVQISVAQQIGTVAAGANVTGLSVGRIDLGALGDELSFDRAFTQPLKKLYASGYSEPVLLLVDALDEADTYTGVKIPDLLSRLSDLPTPIRILATTRDEPEVLKFFRSIKPFDLVKDADSDVDDVRTYVAGRLTQLTAVPQLRRDEFADRLAQKAEGVFLYAALVLDELLNLPPSESPDLRAYLLPTGLGGIYHEYLLRRLGKILQRWFDLYEPMLGLIAVAQGEGLTAEQLTNIIGTDIRAALLACKQYLSGELPDGPFRLFHKSFADFLLESEDNIDYHIDPEAMHQRIVDHYRAGAHSWATRDWNQVNDYGLRHLTVHLEAAGRIDDLHDLLACETAEHRNVWYAAKEFRGDTAGYRADILRAWRLAEAAYARQPSPIAIGLQCHYALVLASLNSIAGSIPHALVTRLVEVGEWSPQQGLAYIQRMPGGAPTGALAALARHLLPATVQQLIGEPQTQNSDWDWRWVERVGSLARRLEEPARSATLRRAVTQLVADNHLYDVMAQTAVKSLISSPLPAEMVEEIFRAVLAVNDQFRQLSLLKALAPSLPQTLVREALNIVPNATPILAAQLATLGYAWDAFDAVVRNQANMSEARVADSLELLSSHLDELVISKALMRANRLKDPPYRAEALIAVARRLGELKHEDEMLRWTKLALERKELSIDMDEWWTRAIVAIGPFLPADLQSAALERVRTMEGYDRDRCHADVIEGLAPHLPRELAREALREVEKINDKYYRSRARTALLVRIAKLDGIESVLDTVTEIRESSDRVDTLVALADHLTHDVMDRVLTIITSLESDEHRAKAVGGVAARLPARHARAALDLVRGVRDRTQRVTALVDLAPYLPPQHIAAG
jgi:hypothetical protein